MTPSALNLIDLAKAAGGSLKQVPGTALEVEAIERAAEQTLDHDLWLLVLQGEVIVDLPHGDFRHLKVGDSLTLVAGLRLSLTPLRATVVLRGCPC